MRISLANRSSARLISRVDCMRRGCQMACSHMADSADPFRSHLAPRSEQGLPLHELPSICCSCGGCRSLPSWPMGTPQEGWLEFDGVCQDAIQVDLVSSSGRGVGVVLTASYPALPGMHGMLITPMHGGGCNHRPVFCCWQRPHPQLRHLQCVGLRFDFGDEG